MINKNGNTKCLLRDIPMSDLTRIGYENDSEFGVGVGLRMKMINGKVGILHPAP